MAVSHSHWDSSSLWLDKNFLLGNHLRNVDVVSNRCYWLSGSLPVVVVHEDPTL